MSLYVPLDARSATPAVLQTLEGGSAVSEAERRYEGKGGVLAQAMQALY